MNCELCKRELVPGPTIDEHHLIPRLKGGKNGPKVTIHKVCHRFIHATFTEAELARTYNTIEKLLEHDAVQKFVKWVAKKPAMFYDSTKMSSKKTGRNRR